MGLLLLLLRKLLGLLLLVLLLLLGRRRRRRRLPWLGRTTLRRHCCCCGGRAGVRRKDRNLSGRRGFPRGLLLLKKLAVAEGNVRTGKSRARSKIEPCLKKSLVCEGISGMRGCCC